VIRQGPISRLIHGAVEYTLAVILLAAPFVLSFDSGAAKAASIVAGVLVLIMAAVTDGPTSLVNSMPLAAHILLDYVLAGLLIAAPFLFGFSHETAPTAFFIVLGVLQLLVTIATRYKAEDEPPKPLD
jgi:hypothetical protein